MSRSVRVPGGLTLQGAGPSGDAYLPYSAATTLIRGGGLVLLAYNASGAVVDVTHSVTRNTEIRDLAIQSAHYGMVVSRAGCWIHDCALVNCHLGLYVTAGVQNVYERLTVAVSGLDGIQIDDATRTGAANLSTFRNCSILRSARYGIALEEGCSATRLDACNIENSGDVGLMIADAVTDCRAVHHWSESNRQSAVLGGERNHIEFVHMSDPAPTVVRPSNTWTGP